MMSRRRTFYRAAVAAAALAGATTARAQIASLDKGHSLLVNSGLQIWGLNTDQFQYNFNYNNFTAANMNAVIWSYNQSAPGALSSGQKWGKWIQPDPAQSNYQSPSNSLNATEQAHYNDLVAIQVGDEQQADIENPNGNTKTWFTTAHNGNNFADKLMYVNSAYITDTNAYINFLASANPDAISWDSYPFGTTGVYPNNWLGKAQIFRRVALGSYIGASGTAPRPYGLYLQTYHGGDGARDPGDLEMRWQQFTAWTLGYTFVDGFTAGGGNTSLFNSGDGNSPHQPIYNQFKESSRQSRNLGPALTHLISYGYGPNIVLGQDPSGATNAVPVDWPTFNKSNAPTNQQYLSSLSAQNLGTKNGGHPGDVYVGFFNPLQMSYGDPAGEAYFMVTNALGAYLQDPDLLVADCTQRLTLNFDFGTSGITSLQRLRRSDGTVEVVPLTHTSGNQYQLVFDLEGGTGDLFKYNDGTPFVGVQAAPVSMFWDGDGIASGNNTSTGTGLGGSGSWEANKWYTNGGSDTAWTPSNNAVFYGPSAGTVTLASPHSASTLTFKTNGYIVTGSTLTMVSGGITVDTNVTATINSNLASTVRINKSGAGTLILGGTNTFNSGITVSAGTLRVSSDVNLGAAPSSLDPTNITLDGGTLQLGGNFDLNNNRGIFLTTNGGTIDTNGFANPTGYIQPNGITGPGNLTKTGAGTFFMNTPVGQLNSDWKGNLILKQGTWKIAERGGIPYNANNDNIYHPGQITFDGGALQITANIGTTSNYRGITINPGGGTLDTQEFNFSWGGPVIGNAPSSAWTKIGSGVLTLNSASATGPATYNGTVAVNGGTLVLNGGTAMGDSAAIVLANTPGVALSISGANGETIGSLAGGGASGGNLSIAGSLNTGSTNATTTFGGTIIGGGGLTKSGTGTMLLNGAATYAGATNVAAGKLSLGASLTGTSSFTVQSGASADLTQGNNKVLRATAITINGPLDLRDNKLITRTALATVTNLVKTGRNGGAWNGIGIITSMTAANGLTPLTTLAVAANSVLGKSTFGGQSVDSTDVLVAYTYAGDLDLDGDVDGDDYFRIDNGYVTHATAYVDGDVNYDGKINADDYFLVDRNYSRQTVHFSAGPLPEGVSVVPEPAGLALIAIAAASMTRRQRRCRAC